MDIYTTGNWVPAVEKHNVSFIRKAVPVLLAPHPPRLPPQAPVAARFRPCPLSLVCVRAVGIRVTGPLQEPNICWT